MEMLDRFMNNGALVTFFVSMVPVLELRGAIPVGVSMGLSHFAAMMISIVGNLVPVPFIILFVRRVFDWMQGKSPWLRSIVEKLEKRAESKRGLVERWAFWGLVILVAVPLPGTGAWTGALVAALMNMRLKKAMPAIALGVLVAGIIVVTVTYGITGLFT